MRAESERQNEQQRRYQRNVAIICPVVAAVGLLDALCPSILARVDFVALLFRMWACFLPLGAIFFIIAERRLRGGVSLHCPSCDYEFAPGADGSQSHAERCPECGAEWREKWVKGRRRGSPARIRIFVACGLVGLLVATVNASRSLSFGARFTPTWLLVHHLKQAADRRSFRFDDTWKELATREIDPDAESELVNLVIDSLRSDSRGFTSRSMATWFTGALAGGRVSAATIERYFEQRVTSSLAIERNPQGGRDAVLRVIDHDDDGYGDIDLVLARCWLEPSGTDLAMQDGWYGAAYMQPNAAEPRDTTLMALPGIADTNPSFRVAIPESVGASALGGQRVRATVWLFWSSTPFRRSVAAPEDLVADPTLDTSVRLLRTIELEADLIDPKP